MSIFLDLMTERQWELVKDCVRFSLRSNPSEETFEALTEFLDLLNQFVPDGGCCPESED